LIASI